MYLLLSTFTETILPLIVLVIGIALAVLIVVISKRKFKPSRENFRTVLDTKDISVTAIGEYCDASLMKFLDSLHMALPVDFIAFPKVGVDQLVTPGKNRVAYNSIMSKYVDVVVFYRKTMQPVLVIDLYNANGTAEHENAMDKDVEAVLKAVKLNVVQVKIEKAYNLESLRHQLIHSVPDKILAEISVGLKK